MLMGTVKSCTRAGGATVNVPWCCEWDSRIAMRMDSVCPLCASNCQLLL